MSFPMTKLIELTEKIGSGVTPRGGDSVYVSEGTSLIRSQNVYNSQFTPDGLAFLDDETANKMKGVTVFSDDVLLNITGDSVARCCKADERYLPARVNQHVAIIRPQKNKLDPDFLMFYMTSPYMQAKMLSWAGNGGTRKALTKAMIEGFEVPTPDINVQREISGVLKNYNGLIENNKRRIELLEESARQLYKEWFVRFRFPGHEHVKVIDGVPKGWEKTVLGAVSITNALSHKAKELPEEVNYIDISAVSTGRIETKNKMSAEDAPGRARRIAQHGDVIWSNVRPNLKAYALVLHPDEIDVFSTGFTTISGTRIPYSFLYNFTTTDNFVKHLVNHTTGSSYPAVRPPDFEKAELLLPPQTLLEQFHAICEPSYELAFILGGQTKQLAEARDLLLPKLMSGEIAV